MLSTALILGGCSRATVHEGSPRMMDGRSGYVLATPTCTAPASLPGPTVRVTLSDHGMSQKMGGVAPMGARMRLRPAPRRVAAGPVSFVAVNRGWRDHELVILPLAAGSAVGQRDPGAKGRVAERGALGEASASCGAGTGDGIVSGATGWTTVTLAPGRYELVCNLRNHYANGMRALLVVT